MRTNSPKQQSVPQRLSIDLVVNDEGWPATVREAKFVAAIAAAIESQVEFDVAETAVIALASDRALQELTPRNRGKDHPTNLLSFPSMPAASPSDQTDSSVQAHDFAPNLGDIILALETDIREAEDKAIGIEAHTTHLIVHGILHLLGYDHEAPEAAEDMEALEIDILSTLGIDNPYTEELVGQD